MIANWLVDSICNLVFKLKALTTWGSDIPNWDLCNDENVSLKTTYNLISSLYNLIWKLAHGLLLTNATRARLRITNDDLCPRCQSQPENIYASRSWGCSTVLESLHHVRQLAKFFNHGLNVTSWQRTLELATPIDLFSLLCQSELSRKTIIS